MIRARLIVQFQFDKDADDNAREENWGEFDFVTLPRVGELVDVLRDNEYHTVVVRTVDHTAVSHPRPQTGMATIDDDKPTVRLIADWRYSD